MMRLMFLILLSIAATSLPAKADGDPFRAIPVPMATLYAGDRIDEGVLTTRRYRKSWLARQSVAMSDRVVVGLVAKRTIPRGRPIPLNAVGEPSLIARGERTMVEFRAGSLTITAQLIALDDAGADETVSLRNPETGEVLSGRVSTDGRVEIMP